MFLPWTNGAQVPTPFLNHAFNATGPFYAQLPAAPQFDADSTSAIAYYFAGRPGLQVGWIDGDSAQKQYDYSFPIYTASTSDSLVTIACNHIEAVSCVDGGAQIYLPALAEQAGGGDHHLGVIQPNGIEYDFWLVTSNAPYANHATLSAAGEAHFVVNGKNNGTNYVAPGFQIGAATAGGIALSIGQIYTSELAAGVINHAISLTFPCGTRTWVYPASQTTGICENGQGMPLGSRVWWQPNDVQTQAMRVSRDMQTVLIALHHYGGFFTDGGNGGESIKGGGGGMGTRLENQEAYWIYGGGADPALTYAANAPGWNHVTTADGVNRYVLSADGEILDLLDNLKVLAPCVTQGTC